MSFTTVLFDLDGTLLPMDLDLFLKSYFSSAAQKLVPHGFDPELFISALWKGSIAMVKNNGQVTNDVAFWNVLHGIYGVEQSKKIETVLEEFYEHDFDKLSSICGYCPDAKETVHHIKETGLTVALATNPLFPHMATESRIRWTGLSPSDFALYTTYETSSFAKPSPGYYLEVAGRLGVAPEDCLMVGNDTSDDLSARDVGMDVFILTDWLINKNGTDLSQIPHGSFAELSEYIENNHKNRWYR